MQDDALSSHNASVLIVDDSLVERNLYVHMVRKWGYTVDVASDGESALQKIRDQRFQLVLADWQMPGMNGTELCSRVRQDYADRSIYIILMSAQREEVFLISALEAGADDVLSKPVDTNELEARLHSALRRLALQASLTQQTEKIAQAHDLMAMDLRRVSQVQRSFLPEPVCRFEDLNYHWMSVPSQYVSGDHLNVFPLGPQTYAFYILDVSGHGIPAAVKSMQLVQMLSDQSSTSVIFEPAALGVGTAPRRVSKPRDVVSRLNRLFQQTESDLSYFTLIYGILDTACGHVTLCQAGHPTPFVLRNSGQIERFGQGGYPVGLFEHDEYEDLEFDLAPGESLFLYSDGVTEVLSAEVEQFGEPRLIAFLEDGRQRFELSALPELLRKELLQWGPDSLRTQGFEDDLSILFLTCPLQTVSAAHSHSGLAEDSPAPELAVGILDESESKPDSRGSAPPQATGLGRAVATSEAEELTPTINVEHQFFDAVIKRDRKLSIVIADDSRSFLRIFEAMLSTWGYQVYPAQSGHEAIQLIETHRPDFVLTDWDMPGMSGIELCEYVRAQNFASYIYLIMITGFASRDDLLRSLKVGADDFLTKPLNPSELKVRLKTAERISILHRVLQEKHKELNRVYQSLQRDMREVSRIQRSLLPKSTQSPWPVAVQTLYRPKDYVCGEQLGTLKTQNNELGFLSISLPGQGTSTALQAMALLRWFSMARATQMLFPVDAASTRIRRYLTEPAKILSQLHEFSPTYDQAHSRFDLLYGLLNLDQGSLLVAGIGRWVLVLIEPDGGVSLHRSAAPGSDVDPSVPALGVVYQDVIKPGSRFFVCSEVCLNALGLSRLDDWAVLSTQKRTDLTATMSSLTGLANEKESFDLALMGFQWREESIPEVIEADASLLAAWQARALRLAAPGSDTLRDSPCTVELGDCMGAYAFRTVADTATIAEVGRQIRMGLEQLQTPDRSIYSTELVLSEAMTNVMYHGFRAAKPEAMSVIVLAYSKSIVVYLDDKASTIPEAVLSSIKSSMDYMDTLGVNDLPEGGMGLTFIRMAAERFRYHTHDGINSLELLIPHETDTD